MKLSNLILFSLLFFISFSLSNIADEIQENEQDKTLSPYFHVESDDPDVDQLPLYSTTADVKIRGVIADVKVTQIYQNTGKKPLEAIYVFPMSTKAAVYAMTMKIEDRVLKAEIQEKEQARKIYEEAKEEGKTASLLEQHRPNVFRMNVANIMPGDSLIVELRYTELLVPEDGIYEFVYPTVVGPRYSNTLKEEADGSEDYVDTPYTHEGEDPTYKFDIDVEISGGMALTKMESLSHDINTDRIKPEHIKVSLEEGQEYSGNKDFILRYSYASNRIKSGLLMSNNEGENFFLLMLQPPKRVESKDINPREYIFVVDVSGSMNGFPLDITKNMMRNLLDDLEPEDMFNVVIFAGGSSFMSCESKMATPENINRAIELLERQHGGGGTELLPALQRVMNFPVSEGYSRIVTILTDGYVSVEKETYDLIRDNLDKANFFAFGIGSSVNRTIIEGIGTVGMGESFVVTDRAQSPEVAEKYRKYIESPVMTDITMESVGFLKYDVIPKKIPDLMAERPILIFGKYMNPHPKGVITVKGTTAREDLKVEVPIQKFMEKDTSQALKYLWARYKLKLIADYHGVDPSDSLKKEITELGLKYNLLTEYTSFVAVDYEVRNNGDSLITVKQPLPLPEGVSDYAVGNAYMSKLSSQAFSQPAGGIVRYSKGNEMSDGLDPALSASEGSMPDIDEFVAVEQDPRFDESVLAKNIVYPPMARLAGKEGTVEVRVLVDNRGNPVKAEIKRSDSELLNEAAINAVMKTPFTPAVQNRQPVASWVNVPVEFNLDGDHLFVSKIDDRKYKVSSGVTYEVIRPGIGKIIKRGDKVKVHIKGYMNDCTKVIDTYETGMWQFEYGKKMLFLGLQDGMIGMKRAEQRKIRVPSHLVVGENLPDDIPEYQDMILEIELIMIE